MFKRSRKKIVAAIMAILVVLWVSTLGVIYASSYLDMSRHNRQMLKAHSDMYVLAHSAPDTHLPTSEKPKDRPKFADEPMFRLSNFYTVAVDEAGTVLETVNEPPTVHTNAELEELALDISADGGDYGTQDSLAYYRADKDGYTLVTFMDNTVINENAATLLRYTLIFGAAAIVVFFFLSVYIAKRIVRPLEDSFEKQKRFISDAGHELKTPVSVVSANAELLAREIGENQWLANIRYENERMGELVTQLLELARTENAAMQTERVDLSRLAAGETLPFECVAFEKGLTLESDLAPDIFVEGDGGRLKQLVSILLDNAVSHAEGGTVKITLSKERSHAVLSVTNEGAALSSTQREHLFDRFYRIDEARSADSNHYGLGLAIAKAICDAHRGHIEVGCRDGLVEFSVSLPIIAH